MKFQLSRQAVNDLREIWLYSEENWGMAKADEYLRMVEGLRRDEDGVVIVRVLHERMDPARHL